MFTVREGLDIVWINVERDKGNSFKRGHMNNWHVVCGIYRDCGDIRPSTAAHVGNPILEIRTDQFSIIICHGLIICHSQLAPDSEWLQQVQRPATF